ncbi:hypothetical protein DM860_015965 [Cuscuta australis]|uniref:Uncharacterized protein n=1 Tax=Cuscuta australis TaxID=267555 RepID=A0A328E226_9ASTE|nr:hypothetical protein DM860_015965 [Cuscuta australis]
MEEKQEIEALVANDTTLPRLEHDTGKEQLLDRNEEVEQVQRISISTKILERDIEHAEKGIDCQNLCKEGEAEVDGLSKEEIDAGKVFAPIFQSYFEAVLRETEDYIREKLARRELLELLKMGLLQDQAGVTFRVTREIVKSMENVDLVNIKGTKYPIFLAYSNYDAEAVTAHNSGEKQ